MLLNFVTFMQYVIIFFFLVVNFLYVIFLLVSIKKILAAYFTRRFGRAKYLLRTEDMPPVSAILPVYNEESTITKTIFSLLNVSYKNFHIVVVNDGSSDRTMEELTKHFQLKRMTPAIRNKIPTEEIKGYYESAQHHNLIVIDKVHSGKADSLNAGINACESPLFLSMDADTVFDNQCIETLVTSMLSKSHTLAEGGSVYVLNACKVENGTIVEPRASYRPIISVQTAEYLRAFLFGRSCWDAIGGPLVLPGALTLFETQAVIELGGFDLDTMGEDMEMVVRTHEYMRRHKYPFHMGFSPGAIAWTHVPETLDALWRQRSRWQQGLGESLFKHFTMFFNPRYRGTGVITFPFHFFVEFLSPIVELLGYISLVLAYFYGILDWTYTILFFLVTWGFATALTMATVLLSAITFNAYKKWRYFAYMLIIVTFESFGLRQLLAICRSYATLALIFKRIFRIKSKRTEKGWSTEKQ